MIFIIPHNYNRYLNAKFKPVDDYSRIAVRDHDPLFGGHVKSYLNRRYPLSVIRSRSHYF